MKVPIFLMALLLTALLSGCLRTRDTTEEFHTGEMPALEAMPDQKVGAPAIEEVSEPSVERKIIKTARLRVEVDDFEAAAREVERLAQDAGGFVSDSNSYITDTRHKRGTITIRVPEGGFLSVLEEIKKLGDVKSTSSSGEDVTEEYIDLDARLRNLEKQEERLLEVLEKADTVDDILKVEEQLGRVRGEIERITGKLRYLENLVSLATITVELFEPEPITRSWGLREALGDAVDGFIGSINALIVLTGSLIPVVIFLLIIIAIFRKYGIIGKLRRKKPKKVEK